MRQNPEADFGTGKKPSPDLPLPFPQEMLNAKKSFALLPAIHDQ
jgi:hypothetical protein